MGNCCVSHTIKFPCCIKADDKQQNQTKIIKIVKADGKVLELTKPTLVKQVLADFNGSFIIESSSSQDDSNHLPLNFELKIGEVYYLIPSPSSLMQGSDNSSINKARRVRIVLTKTELKLLLANQVSMEDMILQQLIHHKTVESSSSSSSSSSWKPVLAAIPEE